MFDLLEEITPKNPPLFGGRVLHKFRTEARDCCENTEDYCGHDRDEVSNPGEADVVSSQVKGSEMHLPVVDLDLPCRLVESATPGHYHLYIDKPVQWPAYLNLLNAFVAAGLVQEGYVQASKNRGYTSVRVPWKPKGVAA